MRAGSLDRPIRIECALLGSRTSSGQPTRTWALQRQVWAGIVENRGQEGFASNQVAAKAEIRFAIRYPEGLEPMPSPSEDSRIVYEGRAYNIIHVDPSPFRRRREELHIFASTRAEASA
jgi:SPP1 family predicted phage head-tail adaptor